MRAVQPGDTRPRPFVPLARTLAAAARYLPPALVDGEARRRLAGIAEWIPAALTRRAYLECRLAAGERRVDLVFCVDRSNCELLRQPHRGWVPAHLQAHPLWAGLERLCAHWADAGSAIGARVYDLWLEFDLALDEATPDPLVPNVFVGLARGASTPPLELWDAGRTCLEILAGQALGPEISRAAAAAVGRLPAGAMLPYVGLMYPRSQTAVRLCVGPLAGRPLLDYLATIAWPGSAEDLRAVLAGLPCGAGRAALDSTTLLHLDVHDVVNPHIGLEIPFAQYPQVQEAFPDRDLLDALCDRGWCAPAKRDALTGWPGFSREQFPHECWSSLALRRVSHVKVSYATGRAPVLKTYMSWFHAPSPRHVRRRVRAE